MICTSRYHIYHNLPHCKSNYKLLSHLFSSRSSDPNERAHFWLPDSEATTTHELLDSPTSSRMYIDQNETVRIRVEADEFYDDEPGPPKAAEGVQVRREQRRAPFSIIVSITLFLLGCVNNE